jgi:sulfite dehydrogenase
MLSLTLSLAGCQTSTPALPASAPRAKKQVRVNETDIRYVEQGEGVPVVFVHGSMRDQRVWDAYRPQVAARYRYIAVNQCSGNSCGFFNPRVTGGKLANGAMANARWLGVPLKDVLARAEPKNSAREVTFNGLDIALFGGGDFVEALQMNHATDGEVMFAYQMNGADIQMLNGYPVKLIVPGYYGTYWVKHLSEIEVVEQPFEGFWMKPAYRVPDNDCACVEPRTTPAATRAIDRFNVRSFITLVADGGRLRAGQQTVVRGIAVDGGQGVLEVANSTDGGQSWRGATLGADLGHHSSREFTFGFTP